MSSVVTSALAGMLAVLALSACGSPEHPVPGSASTPSAPTTPAIPPTTGASPQPPDDLTVPPRATGKVSRVRVSGTVSDGVEPGCRLLVSKGAVYLLIWRNGRLTTGQRVQVEGTVAPALTSTCQQGIPLMVERVISP
jgi:hypothetical protein